MKKVLNTTEFVLWLRDSEDISNSNWMYDVFYKQVTRYADLMQTPLSLSMFIPCDDKGEPMEKPEHKLLTPDAPQTDQYIAAEKGRQYQQAQDKVLFKAKYTETAIEINGIFYTFSKRGLPDNDIAIFIEVNKKICTTVEDLAQQIDLPFIPNFLKKIGLTEDKQD